MVKGRIISCYCCTTQYCVFTVCGIIVFLLNMTLFFQETLITQVQQMNLNTSPARLGPSPPTATPVEHMARWERGKVDYTGVDRYVT